MLCIFTTGLCYVHSDMEPLRQTMIAHGIPAASTDHLANALRINSVEDLAAMHIDMLSYVPTHFRQRVADVRNFHKPDDATIWTMPAEEYWVERLYHAPF